MAGDEANEFCGYVEDSREALAGLLDKIEVWRNRQPEVARVKERLCRADSRLTNFWQQSNFNKRGERSRLVHSKRTSEYTQICNELEVLKDEACITGQGLRRVLGFDEAERFIAGVKRSVISNIDPMWQASQWAAKRVEEFRQACQAMPAARPNHCSAEPAERWYRRLDIQRIKDWMAENYDNQALAAALGKSQRVVSSLLNNGRYHGQPAVAKLAKLMGLSEPTELYLE